MAGIIGWPELIIVLVIVVFIFGAGRITDLGKALGTSVREYKKATTDNTEEKEKDSLIREAALKMGIDVEGKTTSQLLEEMNKKNK